MLKHKVMIEGNMKGMARLSLLSLTIAVLLAAAATAKADPVSVVFTPAASQVGLDGQTLTFDVNVLNTSSTETINLDSDDLNIAPAGNDLVTNDEFIANAPFFLNPAGEAGDFASYEAFTVFIPNGTPDGIYGGSYVIEGDAGGAEFEVGSGTFFVNLAPEPSSLVLAGTGLLLIGILTRRRLVA